MPDRRHHQVDQGVAEGIRAQVLRPGPDQGVDRPVEVHNRLGFVGGTRREPDEGNPSRVHRRFVLDGGMGGQPVERRPPRPGGRGPVQDDDVLHVRVVLTGPAGDLDEVLTPMARDDDQDLGPGAAEHEGDLVAAVGDRYPGVHGAEAGDREHQGGELDPVRQHHRHGVAGPHAERAQSGCQSAAQVVELGVGQATNEVAVPVEPHGCGPVRCLLERVGEIAGDVHVAPLSSIPVPGGQLRAQAAALSCRHAVGDAIQIGHGTPLGLVVAVPRPRGLGGGSRRALHHTGSPDLQLTTLTKVRQYRPARRHTEL